MQVFSIEGTCFCDVTVSQRGVTDVFLNLDNSTVFESEKNGIYELFSGRLYFLLFARYVM